MRATILQGDCRSVLPTLQAESVHCVVTSPPYFGLRDYGHPDQIGLEETPQEYVAGLVDGFRQVRRVLRPDGVVWLNLGDSYASDTKGSGGDGTKSGLRRDGRAEGPRVKAAKTSISHQSFSPRRIKHGLKTKDLIGVPWRVAFALQDDGWWLRRDVIWEKPNAMPESVSDRPSGSHEYVFLLTKSPDYFYDADAIRETMIKGAAGSTFHEGKTGVNSGSRVSVKERTDNPAGRNKRSVWRVNTASYKGAHYATFPPDLVAPMILAGTSERGCCPNCLAPWERLVEKGVRPPEPEGRFPKKRLAPGQAGNSDAGNMGFRASRLSGQELNMWKAENPDVTVGWQPTCRCEAGEPVPCTVLDPFSGSGTVGEVATRLNRQAILIELNPEYACMAETRNAQGGLGL